jgi:septum formation protein
MPLWLADRPLILASKSSARRAMLEAAGIPVETAPADIDERALERNFRGGADEVASMLAREKARAVAAQWPDRLVVGADQTLALGQTRFSKPADRAAARTQLKELRGRTHELHSAVALIRNDDVLFEATDTARLRMRAFSDSFLDGYLDETGGAASASVGGYQLEGRGIQLFEGVEGDYFTILGLPLLPLLIFLRSAGALAA